MFYESRQILFSINEDLSFKAKICYNDKMESGQAEERIKGRVLFLKVISSFALRRLICCGEARRKASFLQQNLIINKKDMLKFRIDFKLASRSRLKADKNPSLLIHCL
ncbi:hypothetical protein A0O21_01010 [Streptococcus pantholopis]|uniref:Uncharacterized protein n=1 Tax=Streptococcus pantholopis TaxID=1811193 RepID=A0A172Q5K2_9STRE|nr:hypothetical protein A0O21_01010 [Streptococcus pantholopis]